MRHRIVAAAAAAVLCVVWLFAGVASAHVTVDPDVAVKGADAELAFRVPQEEDNSNTVSVAVKFPTDHPIADVAVKPTPGWTYKVTTMHLAKPITTDDGTFSDVVSEIVWSGGTIKPGEYQDFTVSASPMPTDTNELQFPTIQTLSNGQQVAWNQPTVEGAPEPDHPAPTLKLVSSAQEATGASDSPSGSGSGASVSNAATKSQVDNAHSTAVTGIIIGAIGAVLGIAGLAVGAMALRRRRSQTT